MKNRSAQKGADPETPANEKPIAQKWACGQNEYYACPKKGEHEK